MARVLPLVSLVVFFLALAIASSQATEAVSASSVTAFVPAPQYKHLYDLLESQTTQATYYNLFDVTTEMMAAAELSSYVYKDPAVVPLSTSNYVVVLTHSVGTASVIGVRDTANKRLYISFRGTIASSLTSWLANLDARWRDCPWGDCGSVHKGFLEEYLGVADMVLSVARRYVERGFRLIFTGHSKGAAHASLSLVHAYYQLHRDNPEFSADLITFGSPRVGDEYFADTVMNVADTIRRIVSSSAILGTSDIVTNAPPSLAGFQHIGDDYYLGTAAFTGITGHFMSNYVRGLHDLFLQQRGYSFSSLYDINTFLADEQVEIESFAEEIRLNEWVEHKLRARKLLNNNNNNNQENAS